MKTIGQTPGVGAANVNGGPSAVVKERCAA